jgi:hypothetical protein
VEHKRRAWLLVLIVAGLCSAAIWTAAHLRSKSVSSISYLLDRLPKRDAVVLFIDFAALRRGGVLQLLDNAQVAQEPEYREFVRETEFNYAEDLESVLISLAPNGKYFLVKGQFDWRKLRTYVSDQGGRCNNTMCRVAGSRPERQISFYPVRSDIMALAVSPDDSAVGHMNTAKGSPDFQIPTDPVWISVPSATLKNAEALPEGTRMFARSLTNANQVTISLGPSGERFEAKLNVRCRSEQDAVALVSELERATGLLRDMIEREKHTPNPRDLSGVLTAGKFHAEGRLVLGSWPIQKAFVEEILGAGPS